MDRGDYIVIGMLVAIAAISLSWGVRADTCHDMARLVESIEQTPAEKRTAQLEVWKRLTSDRPEVMQLIFQAEAHLRAGMTADQAWRSCKAY